MTYSCLDLVLHLLVFSESEFIFAKSRYHLLTFLAPMGDRNHNQPPAAHVHEPFDDAFWRSYLVSLSSPALQSQGDFAPVSPKKFTTSSPAVATVLKYFEALKLPVPPAIQIVALLKSPFTFGDPTRTFFLIRFFQVSRDGFFLTNQNQDRIGGLINYVGAENWENVMCYLDALLFAMFANLESFEPILFISNQHPNAMVTRLSALLRLYVNLLRSGNLVTRDITMRICEVLLALGFEEAMSHKQQDSAAMFEFLTETLAMPLLTFKIEIQHGGKFSEEDDLKISKERILFVSVPEEGTDDILLEECLEHYFNNSISVKRELERRATLENILKTQPKSGSVDVVPTVDEVSAVHENSSSSREKPSQDLIEDIGGSRERRASSSDVNLARKRSDSKVSTTRISVRTRSSTLLIWSLEDLDKGKPREVNLLAWMFLRLMPFYTDDNIVSDKNEISLAKNSREFVDRRPILPICLKRYSFSAESSTARRSLRRIIIPPVINVPEFVADEENASAPGEFKLVLESAVCHRGTSILSGHFVSAIRKDLSDISCEEAQSAPWMLYDDMAKKGRVVQKTFKEIFDKEWPYILFYRLVSNDEVLESASSSIKTRGSSITKPFIVQQGARNKYWNDTLSPIVSSDNIESSSLRKTSTVASVASIPIPDITPLDSRFVDIRNKYFWYVTDENKLYYKELPTVSKSRLREYSVSMGPPIRRNSQWSTATYKKVEPEAPQKEEVAVVKDERKPHRFHRRKKNEHRREKCEIV